MHPRPIAASHDVHHGFDKLPPACRAAFEAAAERSFFAGLPWLSLLAETTLAGREPLVYAVGTWALLAAVPGRLPVAGRRLAALANCYSCEFRPLLAEPVAASAGLLAQALAADAWDMADINSLDVDDPAFPALVGALAGAGFRVQSYFHFGNWYERTTGLDHESYLARLPGRLRNTLRRRERRLAASGRGRFELIAGADGLEAAIAAYLAVYRRSWKRPEPYPDFIPRLIRRCAALGCLRLGLLWIDGTAAAAQIWIVWGERATIFKLAHDESFREFSPGSLLTSAMLRQVLDEDRVAEVDFGRGDDAYKRLWLPRRRERWGIAAFNRHTLPGRALGMFHLGGQRLKRMLR